MKNTNKIHNKILTSAFVLASTIFCANAEQSGKFVGVEVGYGEATLKDSVSGVINGSQNYKGSGVKYGITAGYKTFFNEYFGLRYYVNINAMHLELENDTQANVGNNQTTMLNYGVNVDALANFIAHEWIDFGGFVGLGLGANTWLGEGIDEYERSIKIANQQYGTDWSVKTTGFDVALNVGLRANIAKYHGLEVVGRIPFLPTEILNESTPVVNVQTGITGILNAKGTLSHTYSISVRYTLSF